jgi:hypothetical protein
MLVLIGLIQEKKTVIFHSCVQNIAWIFPENGTPCRLVQLFINTATIPELKDPTAFYIYDAKAGNEEPVYSSAKLILFSSTNELSYKQTQRRAGAVKLLYPSLSQEEFDFYASQLKVDVTRANQIKQIIGHGKIRSLSTSPDELEYLVNAALARFDYQNILVYASSQNTFVRPGETGAANPAILLDAYVREENLEKTNLLERYRFGKARWIILSESVRDSIINKYQSQAEEFLAKVVVSAGQTRTLEILGAPVGRIFEILTPGLILSRGLTIEKFLKGEDIMIGGNLESLPAGYTEQKCDQIEDINYILDTYTNPDVLYSFCGTQKAFDYFIPPNNFLQLTGTLTDRGQHTLLLTTVRKICQELQKRGLVANFITTIKAGEQSKWNKSPQSFVIDDNKVVAAINTKEKSDRRKDKFKLKGVRSFEKLPDETKRELGNLRQYIGVVSFQRK